MILREAVLLGGNRNPYRSKSKEKNEINDSQKIRITKNYLIIAS